MSPPQAPPAHVAHANQAAIDTLQRLADTQRWLADQRDALTVLPPTLEADAFLGELDAFWSAPVEHVPGQPPVPRRQALALRLAQAAGDVAALRGNDGTLDDEDVETIRAVALHRGGRLPGHLHVREFVVHHVSLAGALVVWNDRRPGHVFLFTVERGWQGFDSLEHLHREVEERMCGQLVEADDLPAIAMDDLEPFLDIPFLDSRPVDGDAFDVLAARLVARMRERAASALKLAAISETVTRDALHDALDPHALLDIHAIVRHRDLALAARRDEERLARQPLPHVRAHWRSAAGGYRDQWQLATLTTGWSDADSPDATLSLPTFAEDALATALHARGIGLPATTLFVRLTHRTLENPLATAIKADFAHEDLSLLALAFRNIGALPTEGLQVIHPDGSPRDDVSASTLRDVVRELDLPKRYARYLDQTFGDTPQGRARRQRAGTLQQARMRFEAADARLAYADPTEPRSFRDSHDERGFRWVQAVLDHPAPGGRARVHGHEIVVHQLTYQGAPVSGVFLFAARQTQAVRAVVLYTPDAPDGVAYREFGDRAELTRHFLLDRRFEDYLLDRLPAASAERDDRGRRHFRLARLNGDRTASGVFSLPECTDCTQLAERFQEREITGSFLDAGIDTAIQQAKRNANDLVRSTASADVEGAWDAFWGWNFPVQFARELVVGTVKSVPHTAQAAWRFYDQVKAGDGGGAFLSFVDGYTSALAVPPLYTQVPVLAGARVRATYNAHGRRPIVPSQRSVPAPETLFEKRYLADDVVLPADSQPNAAGVHTVDGAHYIRHGGKLYRVRYNSNFDAWQLSYRGATATSYGPTIERLPSGQWRYRNVGLAGGSGRGQGHLFNVTLEELRLVLAGTPPNPSVAVLTASQRVVLWHALLRRLPDPADFLATLHYMITRDAGSEISLPLASLQAWNESIAVAKAAPRGMPNLTPFNPPPASVPREPGTSSGASHTPGRGTTSSQVGTQTVNLTPDGAAAQGSTHVSTHRLGEVLLMLDGTPPNPSVAALSTSQREVLRRTLRERLPVLEDYASTMHHMLSREPGTAIALPLENLEAWNDALAIARTAPEGRPLPAASHLSMRPGQGAGTSAAATVDDGALAASRAGPIRTRQLLAGLGIAADAWPNETYLYMSQASFVSRVRHRPSSTDVVLPHNLHKNARKGAALTTLPPSTPLSAVPAPLLALLPDQIRSAAVSSPGLALGSASGGWLLLDMQRLSRRTFPSRRPALQLDAIQGSEGNGFLLRNLRDNPRPSFDWKGVVLASDDFTMGGEGTPASSVHP